MNYKNYTFIIGIDPGVNTGLAVWRPSEKLFTKIDCLIIVDAMFYVKHFPATETLIRFEDARLRKWFGKAGREQLQGAGSIKRDCAIWQEFCEYFGFDFEAVPPKNNKTKTTAKMFKSFTGYEGQTNEHSRDAAMLVYGL